MEKKKSTLRSFSPMFWLVILFEFFERGSYYGMMSILSVYFTDYLSFPKEHVGVIKSTIQPILYFLPIVAGALADRFGYRRTLLVAFSLLGGGYFLTSQSTSYTAVFLSLVVMGLGAGTFKPVISSTIARTTDENNSALGFGIYYWAINLGAFLFPLILVPYLKHNYGWHTVMIASAIGTGSMIIPTLLFFKEPARPETAKTNLLQTLADAFAIVYSPLILLFKSLAKPSGRFWTLLLTLGLTAYSLWAYFHSGIFIFLFITLLTVVSFLILAFKPKIRRSALPFVLGTLVVLGLFLWLIPGLTAFGRIVTSVIAATLVSLYIIKSDDLQTFKDHFRFLLMIFIYSGFWVLYFQMFDSVLWYVKDYVDATSLNNVVNGMLHGLGFSYTWAFEVEHVTVINAGTIILLQLFISNIVKKTKALPTMIAGIFLGTIGMAILAISPSIWVFLAGIVIFSIGEMTAHPKFISYVGQTAPRDKVATYMGYIFLYGVIGSSIGGVLGANLYVHFVDHLHQPRTLWIIFSLIGVVTIAGLLAYQFFLLPKQEE